MTTHIQDVVNAVLYEDLDDIVLLGFSYGGAVVTGSVTHIAGRIRELVFLDAFVPGDGDTVAGLAGRSGPQVLALGEEWLAAPAAAHLRRPRRGDLAERSARCATSPVLHRAGAADDSPRGASVRPHVHQGDRGRARRARRNAFWTAADHAKTSAAMAVLRDRHYAHGRQQPARRAQPHPCAHLRDHAHIDRSRPSQVGEGGVVGGEVPAQLGPRSSGAIGG